jgi:WXXGXW repeat (2 copies)
MFTRKTLLAGAMAASFAGFSLPSYAAAELYISLDPPARRVEHMDARPGYVVVPGNWAYNHGKYEWVNGRYVPERNGYRYQNDRWVQHDNNKWTMQRGGWSRDSDGDGVPDNRDSQPNNPRRQ